MKPCSHHQEKLVWLALGELGLENARQIRSHLSGCPNCREYFEEMSSLSKSLGSHENSSSIQASEAFHHRVVARIKSQSSHTFWAMVAGTVESFMPNWRLLVPAGAAALAILVISGPSRLAVFSPPQPAISRVNLEAEPAAIGDPTLANYLMLANRSLDSLDALLTKQGEQQNPSPAPIYTASVISDWNTSN
jgi:hypothetical protein